MNEAGRYNTLSVLMPVRNEARTLHEIIRRVLQSPIDLDIELVCVDDGSTDGSGDILKQLAGEARQHQGHPSHCRQRQGCRRCAPRSRR